MKDKTIVMLYSGGADSQVMLAMALDRGYKVKCLGINYGQRHVNELTYAHNYIDTLSNVDFLEIDCKFLRHIAPTSSLTNDDIDTPDVSEMRGEAQPLSYVPYRNQLFLSIGCSYAEGIGADEVWFGATGVDSLAGYFDGTPEFVDAINGVVSLNREANISVVAPLIEMNKSQIIKRGVELGVDFSLSYTCYTGGELPSMKSASSSMRVQGFIESGYQDPLQYVEQDALDKIYAAKGCESLANVQTEFSINTK